MKENGSVESVTLASAGVTDAHLQVLAEALEHTSPVSDLRELKLSNNQLSETAVPALLKIIGTKTDLKKIL